MSASCTKFLHTCQFVIPLLGHPRALDPEMRGVIRTKDVKFEPSKLGFVLEAQGAHQQLYMEQGQSKIQNALKQAERSAFELFERQLMSDQAHYRSSLR
eukprot:s300_g12.t1